MNRNQSIERALCWHFWKAGPKPKAIIPPRSVVRLKVSNPDWGTDLKTSDTFRVGYYSKQDGPNCVWLVDAQGKYSQTWDQISLLDSFEIVEQSNETDIYGAHPPLLGPL
jgi:hypothetical protein